MDEREEGFDNLDDAEQARLRQILANKLNAAFFAQLKAAPGFSLSLFLRQPEDVQDALLKFSIPVASLCRDVISFDKLLALPDEVKREFVEYAAQVRKLVHGYRVPLKELLALDAEQRSTLIVNANYFSKILSAPENQRSVDQLLSIADMNLTEAQLLISVDEAIKQLKSDSKKLFRSLRGQGFPQEMIVQMIIMAARDATLLGPQQARNIIEDANNILRDPAVSPRVGKK